MTNNTFKFWIILFSFLIYVISWFFRVHFGFHVFKIRRDVYGKCMYHTSNANMGILLTLCANLEVCLLCANTTMSAVNMAYLWFIFVSCLIYRIIYCTLFWPPEDHQKARHDGIADIRVWKFRCRKKITGKFFEESYYEVMLKSSHFNQYVAM